MSTSSPTASVASAAVPIGAAPLKKKPAATPKKPAASAAAKANPKLIEDLELNDKVLKSIVEEKRKCQAEVDQLSLEYEEKRRKLEEKTSELTGYEESYTHRLALLTKKK